MYPNLNKILDNAATLVVINTKVLRIGHWAWGMGHGALGIGY
ncbi:MAG: hypothetical protein V7K98_27825 [Nostoc sp.]